MVSPRSIAFVVVAMVFAMLARVSAEIPPNTIMFEYSQVGSDLVVTVEGTLNDALPANSPVSGCGTPEGSFTSAFNQFHMCVGDGQAHTDYSLTRDYEDDSYVAIPHDLSGGVYSSASASSAEIVFHPSSASASLSFPNFQTTVSATATFAGRNLDEIFSGATGLLASFTINNYGGTVEIRIAEPDRVLGDPHFFVGRSLYDWKQVGVYDHLVFADHAVTLDVEDFAGCDGEMSGEFILGLSVSGTSWTAACDGIYDANTGELVAKHRFTLTTPCVTATVLLTNGYLNLHNITTSCKVEGGVHKAMTDHASSNVDGWWEWTEAGGFELKDKSVPKLTPLVKKPRVISIDI